MMSKKDNSQKSQTDWERLDKMTDDDIDFSDIPRMTPEMWENGILQKNFKPMPRKHQENFPIDSDIIEFFKKKSWDYPNKINQILRTYMEEVQKQS
ncbi:MAG: BrnA antitoxin family protein [Aridibacter sp.]